MPLPLSTAESPPLSDGQEQLSRATVVIGVAALAVLTRAVNIALIWPESTLFLVEDSPIYLHGRDGWLEHGAFVFSSEDQRTQTERVPGYFLFLMFVHMLAGSASIAIVIAQALVDTVSVICIALLGDLYSRKVALVAGAFAALWPNLIIHSAQVLSDSLFVMFLCIALVVFAAYCRRPRANLALALGMLLGLLAMTRVTAQFAVPVVAVVVFGVAAYQGAGGMRAVGPALLFLTAAVAIASPIVHRNWHQFDALALTSQGGTHLLFWVAPAVVTRGNGTSPQTTVDKLREQMELQVRTRVTAGEQVNAFERSKIMSTLALQAMREQPLEAFSGAWMVGTLRTLGTPALLHDMRVRGLSNASFARTEGSFAERVEHYYSSNTPAYRAIASAAIIGALVTSLLQLIGFAFCAFRRPSLAVPAAALTLYFLALNGPIGDAKYRLPMEPVLIVLAAIAIAPRPRPKRVASA
jgi:4-amino-4-deoxy-L-arabinose transferase-like glycosyltransferase